MGGSGPTAKALAAKTGIRVAGSLHELLARAGILVVAFKPQHLATADPRLVGLTEDRLVISVLAGRSLSALSQVFPLARNVVRSMPNTPGKIGAGVTGWCPRSPLSPADSAALEKVFGALGRSVELSEAQFDAFTAICGCGPAYVFEFAAALRDAAVAEGFDAATARTFAVETILGGARLLASSTADPEVLRNQVASPNGVTAAGLRKLAELDFRGVIKETVHAAKARSREMAG
jgi:pyrroline-5-carboxylate reductase